MLRKNTRDVLFTRKRGTAAAEPPQQIARQKRRVKCLTPVSIIGLCVMLVGLYLTNRMIDTDIVLQVDLHLTKPNDTDLVLQKIDTDVLLPLCNMEQLKKGRWEPHRFPKPPYNPVQGIKTKKNNGQWPCYGEDGPNMSQPLDTFKWNANSVSDQTCSFPQRDFATDFCELAYNKTVAFLGDSITLEQFEDLALSTGVKGIDIASILWDKKNHGSTLIVKTCAHQTTTLMFRRTHFLEIVSDFLNNATPDILLLNTGQWYTNKVVKLIERRYDTIKEWQAKCKILGKDCQLIWRTTVPGHPFCTKYTEPAISVEKMEQLVANISWYPIRKGEPQYHWWDFKHQNQLVMNSLDQSELGFDVLPSYDFLILRPDVHRKLTPEGTPDCAHACLLEGSVSLVNQLFLQLIRLHKHE